MAAETQTGMDRAEMKRLLIKSKQEPVNCAIGVGDDKSVALLMLARNRSSKSLQGDLQKEFPSAFNTRFGTAVVDTDDDPTLVKFMLNKAVTSMARRLVKTLKGTGFRKVQILLEDGSPVEVAADEDDAEQGSVSTPATDSAPKPDASALAQVLAALVHRIADVADPAQKEALAKQAREANVNIKMGNLTYAAAGIESLRRALDAISALVNDNSPPGQRIEAEPMAVPPPPPPPPAAEAKQDAAALSAALAVLVPRIADVADPARKEALAKQARETNVNIKTGNLTYAAAGIESLRQALDAPPPLASTSANQPPSANKPATPRRPVRKPPSSYVSIRGREIWRTARETVDAQIAALTTRLRSMPDPELQRIATFGLNGATGKLSVGLLTALTEVDAVPPDQQTAARDKARSIVGEFRGFLQTNPLIRLLDENPFKEPVTIRATLGAALAQLDQALAA